MSDGSPSSTSFDKLITTIQVAIVAVLIGGGIYFLGPVVSQMWRDYQDGRAKERNAQANEPGNKDGNGRGNPQGPKLPPPPRRVGEFGLETGTDGIGGNLSIELQNNNANTLTQVELTLTLTKEDFTQMIVKRTFDRWDPAEKKKIGLAVNPSLRSCEITGKAKIDNDDARLDARFSFDVSRVGLGKFTVRTWEAIALSWHNVYIMNKSGQSLTDVEITLHVEYTNSKTHVVTKNWPRWDAGVEMTIDIPSHSQIGNLKWAGTAQMGGVRRTIEFGNKVR